MANDMTLASHEGLMIQMLDVRRKLIEEGRGPSIRLTAHDITRFEIDRFDGSFLGMICEPESPKDLSNRERFCVALCNTPLLSGDALVFLCGEDTAPRLKMLHEIMRTGGVRHVIATGAMQDPPRRFSAGEMMGDIMAVGVSYSHLSIEPTARNTREQALAVVPMLLAQDFKRVLLLVPGYHQFRAYLTFLQALIEHDAFDKIHLVIAAAGHMPWLGKPDGMELNRMELLELELSKIHEYQKNSHVASYEQGLLYLNAWQNK